MRRKKPLTHPVRLLGTVCVTLLNTRLVQFIFVALYSHLVIITVVFISALLTALVHIFSRSDRGVATADDGRAILSPDTGNAKAFP